MPAVMTPPPAAATRTQKQVHRSDKNSQRLQEAGKNLFNHAVLLNLTFNRPAVKKGVKKADVLADREDVPVGSLEVSKRIMNWPEYKAVAAKEAAIRNWIRNNSCQGRESFFKNGCYVIPMKIIQKVIDYLEEQEPEYEELVDLLTEAYPMRQLQDKRLLKGQYNELDYPSVLRFRNCFGMDYFPSVIDVPNGLQAVAPQIFKIETEKAQKRLVSWANNMEQGLAQSVSEVWQYLADRFSPELTPTGKRKSIKADAIDSLMETVGRLKTLNITNNPLLESQIEELEKLVQTPVYAMKEHAGVRNEILKASEVAIKALDNIIEDAPSRKISIIQKDDEEVW